MEPADEFRLRAAGFRRNVAVRRRPRRRDRRTAVGTAGAVAAAPFGQGPYGYGRYRYEPRGYNAYAYDTSGDFAPGYADPGYRYDGTAMQYSSSYAARNGFVCHPGTWYTNSFGKRQFCQ